MVDGKGKKLTRRQEIDQLIDALRFRPNPSKNLHTGLSARELARAIGEKLAKDAEPPESFPYRGYTLIAKAKLT